MSLHRVFVYGTLKRAEPNHHWITDVAKGSARFVGPAQTVEKYPLVIGTKFNIPFLLDSPGQGHRVCGEVYEVDPAMLANLDVLEDHPIFYTRRQEDVRLLTDGGGDKTSVQTAWIYFITAFKQGLMNGPFYASYSSAGDHGRTYKERYLRDPSYDYRRDVLRD